MAAGTAVADTVGVGAAAGGVAVGVAVAGGGGRDGVALCGFAPGNIKGPL